MPTLKPKIAKELVMQKQKNELANILKNLNKVNLSANKSSI